MLDLFKRVKARITNLRNWTRFAFARDRAGDRCRARSPAAVCWCLDGAIEVETADDGEFFQVKDELRRIIRFYASLWELNDQGGHAAVLSCLDRVIAAFEREASGIT